MNEKTINENKSWISKETLQLKELDLTRASFVYLLIMCLVFFVVTMGVAIALDIPFERAIVLVLVCLSLRPAEDEQNNR